MARLNRPAGRPAYVCEYCGYQGRDPRPVDEVQCPMCGEPVTPM
jgi:rubrerythrin